MKLPLLLTTLLLTSSPVLADDFLYLKCEVTIERTVFDWNLGEQISKGETDDVIHYKIDTKEDVVFDSTEPEVANEFTTDINQRQIAWKTVKESGSIYEEYTTHLQYETPGGVVGTIYQNDRDRFIEDSGSFRGSCEASNKSAYEAPQEEVFE